MANVRVLILITELKAQVVDDVADVLNNVGALRQVALGSLAADVFETDDGVRVGGGRKTRQDTLLGKEKGARADRHQGTPEESHRSDILSLVV